MWSQTGKEGREDILYNYFYNVLIGISILYYEANAPFYICQKSHPFLYGNGFFQNLQNEINTASVLKKLA